MQYSVKQIESTLKVNKVPKISDKKFFGIPKAAVFVLLIDRPYGTSILLVKRSSKVSTHKGEICFPGGKEENSDKSLLNTAFRELKEEIGVSRDSVNLICSLTPEITRTGYVIIPFVGHLLDDSSIKPDMSEIEKVMFVTLKDIQDPDRKRTIDFILDGSSFHRNGFMVKNYLVWGATSNITNELITKINYYN
jgi:8-oxo-dGTP pyrophosphatase MutT (NUDIX family)